MRFTRDYTGRVRFLTGYAEGPYELLVALPCTLADRQGVYTLLDTASEWSVLAPDVAVRLGYGQEVAGAGMRLHTRFGLVTGWLERIPVRFPAEEGIPLDFEATWFISPDWTGPSVLGWRGGLERFHWAPDPEEEWFYFAPLHQGG